MEAWLIGIGITVVGLFTLLIAINVAIWICLGAIHAWQASLVFIIFGGFAGGGIGAGIGLILGGCVGQLHAKLAQAPQSTNEN